MDHNVLPIILQVVLLVPIGLAFCYSVLAALMVYTPGEFAGCSLNDTIRTLIVPIIFRFVIIATLCVISTKVHLANDQDKKSWFRFVLAVSSLIGIILSYKFIKATRWNLIVGCSNPSEKLETTHGQQTPFLDSKEDIVIVITGANSGIGKETAIQLALLATKRKAIEATTTIILACRTIAKGCSVKQEINEQISTTSRVKLEVVELELCSFESVRKAVATILSTHTVVHCLINNAGVMMKDRLVTADNYETTLQANYLGHFLLTSLLLPHIVPNVNNQQRNVYYIPRILNITSCTYALVAKEEGLPLSDLNCMNRKYTMFHQYSVSKICNIFHAISLAYQYPTIFTASIHPGLVRTDVVRNMPLFMRIGNQAFGWIMQFLQKVPAQGAWCTVDVAALITDCSPANSGKYWLNCHKQPIVYCNKNDNKIKMENDSIKLWYESCKLVHLSDQEIEAMTTIATNGLQRRDSTTENDVFNDQKKVQ